MLHMPGSLETASVPVGALANYEKQSRERHPRTYVAERKNWFKLDRRRVSNPAQTGNDHCWRERHPQSELNQQGATVFLRFGSRSHLSSVFCHQPSQNQLQNVTSLQTLVNSPVGYANVTISPPNALIMGYLLGWSRTVRSVLPCADSPYSTDIAPGAGAGARPDNHTTTPTDGDSTAATSSGLGVARSHTNSVSWQRSGYECREGIRVCKL